MVELPPEHSGTTLLASVSAIAGLEQAAAERLILRGGAWLGRYRVQEPTQIVEAGQMLTVHFPLPNLRPAIISAADVLYEDPALLVLNKPPGIYVTMTPWDTTADLLWATRRFLEERDGAPPTLHLAHQLDRDTSGVLVLTKDPRANAPIQKVFLGHQIHKRYCALIGSVPAWETLELCTGHGRGAHGLFRVYPLDMVGTHPGDRAHVVRSMETHFTVVERFASESLIDAQPLTGRTHQIRLHLAHAGHPIAGDLRYGGVAEIAGIALDHHLLHAAELTLQHPLEHTPLVLTAPLPPLFAQVLETLRAQ